MTEKQIELIKNFIESLMEIASEGSEARLINALTNLREQLNKDEKRLINSAPVDKVDAQDILGQVVILHRMMTDVINLRESVEQTGFGMFFDKYPKITTSWKNEISD